MSNTITLIELVSVDRYGLNFQIAGTHKDNDYRVDMFVECDGRDIDVEPATEGEYDPMTDDSGTEWLDTLMQDQRFIDLNNKGYKAWEAFCEAVTE
jgi:hypothetical protein